MSFGNPMALRWMKLYKGTPAEHSLEPAVAKIGLAYRTQFPLFLFGARYFPDFVIPQLGLVIEVDDVSHSKADKVAADAERTAELWKKYGWRVVRCKNKEALEDPHGTVQSLLREAGITPRDIAAASTRRMEECLPKPGKYSRSEKRAAKIKARRADRGSPEPEPA